MKIALISIYNYRSLALKFLSSFLEKNGHTTYPIFLKQLYTNITNEPTDKEYELLIIKLKEIDPDFIGISLTCSSYWEITKKIIKRLKEIGKPIILGGNHPTLLPDDCIKEVDFVCIGEGEHTLLELLDNIEHKKPIENIKGLWLNDCGDIIKNEMRNLIDLDKSPLPFLLPGRTCYIDNDKFENVNDYLRYSEKYSVITSRGCPRRCTYCSNNAFHRIYEGKGNWSRRRKVDDVIKELVIAKKNNPKLKCVCIEDDLFLMNIKWLREFSIKYKEKINIPFTAIGHFSYCNKEILRLFRIAGGFRLTLGIQSGSENVRKHLFKRSDYTNDQIVETSILLNKFKINTMYDVITDNPFESKEDKEETLNLLLRLKKPFTLNLFSMTYFPKTELTELALSQGVIKKEDVEHIKHHCLTNWRARGFQDNEIKEDSFYKQLYYLTDTYLPRFFIRFLHKNNLFKKYPSFLKPLKYVRFLNYIPSLTSMLNPFEFKKKLGVLLKQ